MDRIGADRFPMLYSYEVTGEGADATSGRLARTGLVTLANPVLSRRRWFPVTVQSR